MLVRLKFAETMREAVTFVEQGRKFLPGLQIQICSDDSATEKG
jgi:ribosomal protein S4